MGRLRDKAGGNNKHPLPTAGHFVKCAAVRGAGGLLGPSDPALTHFREGGCPGCPWRTGVAAHSSCSATPEGSVSEPQESSAAGSHYGGVMSPPTLFFGFA